MVSTADRVTAIEEFLGEIKQLKKDHEQLKKDHEQLKRDHEQLQGAVGWLSADRGVLLGYEVLEQFENLGSAKSSSQGPSTKSELALIFQTREDVKAVVMDAVNACEGWHDCGAQDFLLQAVAAKRERNSAYAVESDLQVWSKSFGF